MTHVRWLSFDMITIVQPLWTGLMIISDAFRKEDSSSVLELVILSVERCGGPLFTWQCISFSTEVTKFSRAGALLIGSVHLDFSGKGVLVSYCLCLDHGKPPLIVG